MTPLPRTRPAILPADRALALTATQVPASSATSSSVQAVYAISADRLDHAEKLFAQAIRIDPAERAAGRDAGPERVRGGHLAADKVKIRFGTAGEKIGTALRELTRESSTPAGGAKAPQPPPAGPPQTPAEPRPDSAGPSPSRSSSRSSGPSSMTLRRARALKLEAPDSAYEDLKRARDSVAANDQLELVRRRLVQDLEAEMPTSRSAAPRSTAGWPPSGARRPGPAAAHRVRPPTRRGRTHQGPHRPVPPAHAAGPLRTGPGRGPDDDRGTHLLMAMSRPSCSRPIASASRPRTSASTSPSSGSREQLAVDHDAGREVVHPVSR